MEQVKRLVIRCWFDGSCEPRNPGGNMGIGALIKIGEKKVFEYADFIPEDPENTNNVAEYNALLAILNWLHHKNYLCANHDIKIFGDSKLVIEQMNGRWNMKSGNYLNTAIVCKSIMAKYSNRAAKISWIPREWNKEADALSKKIMRENKLQFKIQPE